MAAITLDQEQAWVVSRWAFRRVIDCALADVSAAEDRSTLLQAEALDGLHFDLLDPEQRSRLRSAVLVAGRSIRVELEARSTRDTRDQEFVVALAQLESMLAT